VALARRGGASKNPSKFVKKTRRIIIKGLGIAGEMRCSAEKSLEVRKKDEACHREVTPWHRRGEAEPRKESPGHRRDEAGQSERVFEVCSVRDALNHQGIPLIRCFSRHFPTSEQILSRAA
jgi:hypothetical protein